MNSSQTKNLIQSSLLALFAASGPVAKWLATSRGLDNVSIEVILQVANILTPLVAGVVFFAFNTITSKIAAIKAAEPAVQASVVQQLPASSVAEGTSQKSTHEQAIVVSQLPPLAVAEGTAQKSIEEQAAVAAALPDETVIAATAAIPEIAKVVVKDGTSNGAGKLAADPSSPKIDFERNQ